ncbi:hypothetical protein GQF42_16045 [Streptomyces broussonetiae]|uniref:Uncharacterized protein n=1 Tax=Streptomyces broussonetiae TaxID=2686304 RepID=A0A6I6MZ44_9ACTN|nr:hypothetical protein [Streptomyces broussonetiae]QHA04602.1 hypothetical protein GQF42_16045 [Streptomyces broussonetiae]
MQTETLVGLIGFGGAVVGAGGALLGGWLQQHYQDKAAKELRRDERRYATGQTALEMLIRFRHASMKRTEDADSDLAFSEALVEFVTTFDAALYVVPGGDEMRRRVLGTIGLAAAYMEPRRPNSEDKSWIDTCCKEAIGVLSAFLREEPLPEPSQRFLEQHELMRARSRAQVDPS